MLERDSWGSATKWGREYAMRKRFMALAASALIGAGTSGCGNVTQGVLSAVPAFLIGDTQEVAIGLQAAREVVAAAPIYQDPTLANYVQSLGSRIAARTERTNLPWTFTVLQATEPDAFALPGGYIFITTGMIQRMRDEAELAGVLSHEIGHVTARHSVELIRQAAVAQGVTAAVLGDQQGPTAIVANVVSTLVLRGYGRAKELEADQIGARYAALNGFDPRALGDMLNRLEAEGGATPNWLQPLATHPTLAERLTGLQAAIAALGGGGGSGTSGGRGDSQAFAAATASLR